jgi:hypothetical protein
MTREIIPCSMIAYARTEPRAEQVVNVAAADRNVVDVVRRIAVARQHPLDRQLGVLAPLAADAALAVVEEQLDRRPIALRSPAPLKMTSCIDSPRAPGAFDSPSTQRTASMTLICRSRWDQRCRRVDPACRSTSDRRTT